MIMATLTTRPVMTNPLTSYLVCTECDRVLGIERETPSGLPQWVDDPGTLTECPEHPAAHITCVPAMVGDTSQIVRGVVTPS